MPTSYTARPGLLTRDQAKAILDPYLSDLQGDFFAAWEWVQAILDEDPERRASLDSSTHAAMVFDRFVVLMQRRFGANAKVVVKKSGRMMTMNFGGGLLLRFKKFDANLHSHNVKTNAQSRIYWNLTFDGMDPATHVTFGYKLDASGRKVTGVYVTCPIGWNRNEWVLPINEAPSESLPMFGGEPDAPLSPGFTIISLDEKKKSDGQ